jgi:hypothetical protein
VADGTLENDSATLIDPPTVCPLVGETNETTAPGVGVLVGVGAAPYAVPLKLTVWAEVLPLSVIVSLPVSVVPLVLLSVVGLNVIDTVQLPPAEIDDPQEFPGDANGAVTLIEVTLRADVFGFVMVSVLAGDTVPTCTLPKVIEVGENFGLAGRLAAYARP